MMIEKACNYYRKRVTIIVVVDRDADVRVEKH
jgi:hypothetical protein